MTRRAKARLRLAVSLVPGNTLECAGHWRQADGGVRLAHCPEQGRP